ncbi:hypothetical protein ACJX0J_008151, partial [Zea mays]
VRGGARLGRAGGVAPLPVPAGPGARRRRSRNTVLRSTSSPHHGGLRGVWRWLLHKSVSDELTAPPGVEIIDFLEASPSPLPWLSEEELGQYAEKFRKSGFTGPLNYYRMWET